MVREFFALPLNTAKASVRHFGWSLPQQRPPVQVYCREGMGVLAVHRERSKFSAALQESGGVGPVLARILTKYQFLPFYLCLVFLCRKMPIFSHTFNHFCISAVFFSQPLIIWGWGWGGGGYLSSWEAILAVRIQVHFILNILRNMTYSLTIHTKGDEYSSLSAIRFPV